MPLLLHRSPVAGRALAWRSRRQSTSPSPGPGPLAAVRHLFRDHSSSDFTHGSGSDSLRSGHSQSHHHGAKHGPPHRHPHHRKGAELSSDWPTLYLGAKLAYWSGLCYLPYEDIPRTLQQEGLQLVAYGRTSYTSWYVADGCVDFDSLRARAFPGRITHQHQHQHPHGHVASAGAPYASASENQVAETSEATQAAGAAGAPDPKPVGSQPATFAAAAFRASPHDEAATAGGGPGLEANGRRSEAHSHHHHHLPSHPSAAQGTLPRAEQGSGLAASDGASAASSSAQGLPLGSWEHAKGSYNDGGDPTPTPGTSSNQEPDSATNNNHPHDQTRNHHGDHHSHHHHNNHQHTQLAHGRSGNRLLARDAGHPIHLQAPEHPPLHLRGVTSRGAGAAHPPAAAAGVGPGGARQGVVAATTAGSGSGSGSVMGSSAPVVPGTRCRFVFLRGVQWGAHDVNTLSLSAALATFWPTPLVQPANQQAAATAPPPGPAASSPSSSQSSPSPDRGGTSSATPGAAAAAGSDGEQLVAHSGVAALARELLPVLLPYIRDAAAAGVDHIVFAGHSLGGSLAKLLWAMSVMQGHSSPQASSCHTFGSPPVLAHAAGGGGARVLRLLRAPPAAAVNWVLEHDPVPRAMLTADPYFAAARAAVPGLSTLLALRGAVLGEGAALSSGRFLYETVGELLLLRWSSRGGCEVVPVSEVEADSLLKMALDEAVAAPVRTLQYWLDHHHASYHHDLEAAALATCRLQARRQHQQHQQQGYHHHHHHHHSHNQR